MLYQSALPNNRSFDPSQVSLPKGPFTQAYLRTETLAHGHKMVIAALPFTVEDGSRYLIESGRLYDNAEGVLRELRLVLALGFPITVGLSLAGGHLLMWRALVPLDKIRQQAEQITSRNLSERLHVAKTGDELERLATSLNRMIARLEGAFQHASRFSADVSHELRTPLTILRGELEEIAREERNPDLLNALGSALEETERLAKVVDRLLAVSRLDAGKARMERVRLDLADLAKCTAEQMRLLADVKSVEVRYNLAQGVEVEGDPLYLKQAIVNLLDNAIKYAAEGGWVEVKVAAVDHAAILEIADNGPGIPAEALPFLFERFYRADKARSRETGGAGLGLSIVKAICSAHTAEIKVFNVEPHGSCFRTEFPLAGVKSELGTNHARAR